MSAVESKIDLLFSEFDQRTIIAWSRAGYSVQWIAERAHKTPYDVACLILFSRLTGDDES